jgi:excisionase family DNA binding protein
VQPDDTADSSPVRAMRIHDACKALGLSRRTIYREIKSNRLVARKVGSATIVTIESINAWLASLPTTADATKPPPKNVELRLEGGTRVVRTNGSTT